jgi:hypothetical protein
MNISKYENYSSAIWNSAVWQKPPCSTVQMETADSPETTITYHFKIRITLISKWVMREPSSLPVYYFTYVNDDNLLENFQRSLQICCLKQVIHNGLEWTHLVTSTKIWNPRAPRSLDISSKRMHLHYTTVILLFDMRDRQHDRQHYTPRRHKLTQRTGSSVHWRAEWLLQQQVIAQGWPTSQPFYRYRS